MDLGHSFLNEELETHLTAATGNDRPVSPNGFTRQNAHGTETERKPILGRKPLRFSKRIEGKTEGAYFS